VLLFRFLLDFGRGGSLHGNQIGDAGAKDFSEAIKVNGTMAALS
jgi:hypothetical protein